MESVLGCVYFALLAIAMQVVTVSVCARHGALWRWRRYLQVAALLWLAVAVAKKAYIDDIFPPADGIWHETIVREVAQLLTSGRFAEAWSDYFGAGNSGYQFILGVFYAATGAPELVTYAINGALAFCGLLIMLEVLCRQTNCARLPASVVFIATLLPSGLLWTTTNLKEGPILWGICAMCYLTVPDERHRKHSTRILPLLGLAVVMFLRPHIAIAWLVAIAAGTLLHTRRFGLLLASAGAGVACLALLSVLRPAMFEQAITGSLSATLSDFHDENAHHYSGGSTLSSDSSIPVLSGLALILFRPWPLEAQDVNALLAGLEVWALATYGIFNWVMARGSPRSLMRSGLLTNVILLLLMGFFFSYMYNMGLVVRQRLMCFPAVLTIYTWPLLARQQRLRQAVPSPKHVTGRASRKLGSLAALN